MSHVNKLSSESSGANDDRVDLIYVGDPMCSWCWGFSPVLQQIQARFGALIRLQVVVGGLRPGPRAKVLDEQLKATLRQHWDRIGATTGQPFDYGFFDRADWLYDTEPAARALVAVRELAPDQTFAFFDKLQRAFYADGIDITDDQELKRLAVALEGIEGPDFEQRLHSARIAANTRADFAQAQAWGVQGFPTLLLSRPGKDGQSVANRYLLTSGWQPFDTLEPVLERFLLSSPKA